MKGVAKPYTMEIRESIVGLPVLVLINRGASHNFLSEDVANKLVMGGDKRNSF